MNATGSLSSQKWLRLRGMGLSGRIPSWLAAEAPQLAYLDLAGNALTGEIAPELGGLKGLRYLDLSRNALSGPMPPRLGALASLAVLHLNQNSLSGEIPAELGALSELRKLDFSRNQLSGPLPAELGNLTKLIALNVIGNSLSGSIPPELGNLSRLEWLILDDNALSGPVPPGLGRLKELKGLFLHQNALTGELPPELGGLGKLQELTLFRNAISGPLPPQLGGLTELTRLYLHQNSLSGSIPPELGGLRKLEELTLHRNSLSGPVPPDLGNLTDLKTLSIGDNRLSGRLPPNLFAGMTALQFAWVQGNRGLTGDFPSTQSATALDDISADWCGFTGALGLGPAVTKVGFSSNKLRALPAAWRAHARLKMLKLDRNEISGWPPCGVLPRAAFPRAENCTADSCVLCNFTAKLPGFAWPELQELEVSGNPLGPDADARDFLFSLSYLPKLQVLRARRCRLRGEPQVVAGKMQWLNASQRCSAANTLRWGFPSLQVLDLAENSLQALRASPPVRLQVANLSFNALGSWSGAAGAAALHQEWWSLGRDSAMRELDVRGNPALRARVLLRESRTCVGDRIALAADPTSFRPAVGPDGGVKHVECAKPCQMGGYTVLVEPLSLNASAFCRCAAGTAGANLTCQPCPVGTHAHAQNPFRMQAKCRACPAGSTTLIGGRANPCDCACAAGAYMTNATQCNPGGSRVVDPDSMQCRPCGGLLTTSSPGATSRDACICDRMRIPNLVDLGRGSCGCSEGFYLTLDRAACQQCPPGRSAASGAALHGVQGCRVTPDFFLFFICSLLAGTGALVALPMALGILPLHLRDIGLEEGRLVATTAIAHGLLQWRRVQVTFEGTGHPALDFDREKNPAPFLMAPHSGRLLSVLTPNGEPETRGRDTSQGVIHLSTRQALLSAGIWRVPAALVVLLLASSFATLQVAWWRPLPHLLGDLAVCSVLALTVHTVRLIWSKRTPLAVRRRLFGEILKAANPSPTSTPPGAGRGLTIGQLDQLYRFFEHLIGSRDMYYVCSNIVKPITAPWQLSYSDLAGPQQLKWFVSHYWGMGVRHFVEAIQKHARSASTSDWRTEAYWICTFSNNQWRVKEELGNGRWDQSSFYLALRSRACCATLMVVDTEVKPLTRAWCLFEVFQTMELRRHRADFAGLLLGTSSGVLNFGQSGMDVAMELASQVATIDLRTAEASDEDDLATIRRLVESHPGGFDAVNGFVRQEVCDALAATQQHVQGTFGVLMQTLQASLPGGASVARSAGMTPFHHFPATAQGDNPAEDPASPMVKPQNGPLSISARAAAVTTAAGKWLQGRVRTWVLLVAAAVAVGVHLLIELA